MSRASNVMLLRSLLFGALWLCVATNVLAQPPGMDAPQPVGKWLNGIFPSSPPGGTGGWQVVEAFPHLRFIDPVKLVAQPRSNRLFVLGKDGQIWSLENSSATNTKTLVLDIRTKVQSTDNAGLVGMAFHPDFGLAGSANRNYIYLFYYHSPQPIYAPYPTGDGTNMKAYVRLTRYSIPDGSLTADPNSEQVLIQQWDRQAWHNGGSLFFGNDGFLYFCMGDEGLDSDYYYSMQVFNKGLWGGVFRIDVDKDPARSHPIRRQPYALAGSHPTVPAGWPLSYTQNYFIPNDNPWQSPAGAALEEHYAIGVRSPHTMTYDAPTGQIWSGDVGQATWEEVNLIEKGGDYEWPYKEGNHAFYDGEYGRGFITKTHTLPSTQKPPVWEYTHNSAGGTAVIGGHVYRGQEHASALYGKYLFSDHGNPTVSHIWALTYNPPASPTVQLLCDMPAGGFHWNIAAWGQDHAGEVYMIKLERAAGAAAGNAFVPPINASGQFVTKAENGKIYKLARTGTNVPEPPALLSQTGAFANLASLTPASGFIPYEPVAPFWSDGAAKKRWVAIPNNGMHDTAAERITYAAAGDWTFPEGTVFMKHFDLPISEVNPALTKRVETRFFILGTGGNWYGLTYKWRDDGSDADLLYTGETKSFTIATASGSRTQSWTIPSRSDCITCHNPNAGNVLGFRTHQLNSLTHYPSTGRTANQLHTLSALGILSPAPSLTDIAAAPKACNPNDLSQPLELRAKSYLDTNCANCHRPGGANANWDARFTTALASASIINGTLKKSYGTLGEAVVRAHDPAKSVLYTRANLAGTNQMPPLGKNEIDSAGVALIREWINSLNPQTYPGAGAEAEYFNGEAFQTLAARRIDANVDFNWGTASPLPGVNADSFSVRWMGRILPPTTGSYTFYTYTNNGVRLWVQGQQVVNWWTAGQPITENASIPIALTGGQSVNVVMEYFEGLQVAEAHLTWQGPGVGKQIIPAANWFQPLPANGPPFAQNDTFTVTKSGSGIISILGNDVDYEGGLNPGGVQIITPPQQGTVQVNASGQASYIHNGTMNLSDSFVYTVADAQGLPSNRSLVSISIISHKDQWLAANFSSTELANSAISGWGADADGDGLVNLIEYALGSNPRQAGSRAQPSISITGTGLTRSAEFVLTKAAGAEAAFALETSPSLGSWSPAGPEVTILENSASQLRARLPGGYSSYYMRAKISLIP